MSGGASGSWRVELTPWASPWDKMFEDSDSDLLGDGTGCVHNSVKPLLPLDHESNFTTKRESGGAKDLVGNLPATQPSHEHPSLHSPGRDQLLNSPGGCTGQDAVRFNAKLL